MIDLSVAETEARGTRNTACGVDEVVPITVSVRSFTART